MMNKLLFLCGAAVGALHGQEPEFDLKTYERDLKQYIPWSLIGSAQDLRSDAKHQLQLILRSFIFLRPDVPWTEQQKPVAGQIAESFKDLNAYLAEPGNAYKRPWVADSIAYIVNTYIPEVKKLLKAADPTRMPADLSALLGKKKQVLNEFSQSIMQGQVALLSDSDRKA